jgi:hypothetical protein
MVRSAKSSSRLRLATLAALVGAIVATSGCAGARRSSPGNVARPSSPPRLVLDAELSPIPFRWLADDAVLVDPSIGPRKLAAFGNYVERAARKVERARLAVWDDESAWKADGERPDGGADTPTHRRADFTKEPSEPEPVDRYVVFGSRGELVYQRDFRSYPLSELD